MDEREVLRILSQAGAVTSDSHFVYTSGLHGATYVNKDGLYPHPVATSHLCRAIAENFVDERVQAVMGPAIGAVILSQWVAWHLTQIYGYEVLAVYAEKSEDGVFVIRRGYDRLTAGKRVLVVEDVITTGGSAKKVVKATRAIDGNVIGLGVLCNRGGIVPSDVGDVTKLTALWNVKLEVWDEASCPLCRRNVPINTDVGKGREFLLKR